MRARGHVDLAEDFVEREDVASTHKALPWQQISNYLSKNMENVEIPGKGCRRTREA
jgi:hypothetical protein